MNDKTIIRKAKNKENPYVMVNKGLAQDPSLSAKEKGIMFYILSLPDDWKIHISELVNHFTDGKSALYHGMKGLIDKGYIQRIIHRETSGKVIRYEYVVYEEPLKSTVFQKSGNGFSASTNTDYNNNETFGQEEPFHTLKVNEHESFRATAGLPVSEDVFN